MLISEPDQGFMWLYLELPRVLSIKLLD